MHTLHIERAECCGDGLCIKSCFLDCLKLDLEKKAVWKEDSESRCVGCGHCVSVCPRAAITLDNIPPQNQLPTSQCPSMEQAAHLLTSRRSIRHFKKQAIANEKLQHAIHIAGYAPTGTNRRDVGYIVVHTPSTLEALRNALVQWMRPFPRWNSHVNMYEQGQDAILRGAPCIVALYAPNYDNSSPEKSSYMAPQAAASAASYLEIMLHSLGIGTCWSGLIVRGASGSEGIRQLLAVPEGQSIYAAFMVGYPTIRYLRVPFRSDPPTLWL